MATRTAILQAYALTALCLVLGGGSALNGLWATQANAEMPATAAAATLADAPLAQIRNVSAFGLPCGLVVTATALPRAMIALDIMDPCRPDTHIEISHAGLTFDAQTDLMGLLTIDIPAFETPAFVTIRDAAGESQMAMAGLPDLADYVRVAIAWEGDLGLELHAFENDAAFGEPGHVWQEAPGDMTGMGMGDTGFLTILGDPAKGNARQLQIYTINRAQAADLRLTVDIPIKAETCGRPLAAQALRLSESGTPESRPIALTMPGCEALGDFLMLQNPFGATEPVAN